ncbi:MAG: ERCC4 domain-containing protein [Acidimicrobiia bacterium]
MTDQFVVARNPDPESSLPFVLRVPIEGGVFFKTRESWPRANRSYCHPVADWPEGAEIVEEVEVTLCRRRGSAIDLVLDRGVNSRSQFVYTTSRGREIVLWQTAKVARKARPGARVPKRRAAGLKDWQIAIDSRERYPYRFANRPVTTERRALSVGDYAVMAGDQIVGSVERKTLENLSADLISGKLGFVMAELSALPAAAVVVEDRYTALFKVERVEPGWLPELVARVQVRFPNVPIVFCDNRKFAEEWTYRFLGAALAELGPGIDS